MTSCPRADTDFILLAGQISYLQLGCLQHVYKSGTIYDTGMGDQPNGSFFLDYCHYGYLSADSDLFHAIANVRLHADMQC